MIHVWHLHVFKITSNHWRFRIASKSLIESSDQQLREDVLQKLVDQRLMGATAQLSNADPAKLPLREVAHGSFANLFLLYCAFCRMMNEPPAGKTLFYQAAQGWKRCIRFHKRTTHQMCKTCSMLRARIQNASEPWYKPGAADGDFLCVQSLNLCVLRTLKHIWSTQTNFWRTTPSNGETVKSIGCAGRELEVFATSIAASLTATIRQRSCFQLIPRSEHQRVKSTKQFGVTCPNHSTSSIFQTIHYEIALEM